MILKPGRYINHEWNAVHKEWRDGVLKVALCFPDIYEIGMSHLGIKLIYGLLNQEKDVLCERVFAPWADMEKKLRAEKRKLFSLESRKGLDEFDIVGFSLQYEMNYVDVLNMLDIGGIPVFAKDRDSADPLVIAGGSCSCNPEVMADFIDAFVIGEAEEAVLEIARVVQGSTPYRKGTGHGFKVRGARDTVLKEMSKIDGVYVPAFSLQPRALSIHKRIVRDLDNSYFPADIPVPYIQIVHDRVGIEIMRGCPHRCRFCQACKVFHPLRIRSVQRILEIAEASVKSTGYEELSLLSLSTGDYPYLDELVRKLEERFSSLGVKISLPSLRVRSLADNKVGSSVKKAGLTFAPESGSERLRSCLNKMMTNEDIIEKSNLALGAGWRNVKLYFMIGLPGETYEDIDAIIELASHIRRVSLSISPFIPKPHTEFEREEMEGFDKLKDKKDYLCSMLPSTSLGAGNAQPHTTRVRGMGSRRNIRVRFHNLQMSKIEAILSRGDRKIGRLIYTVWQKGARLQAWGEYFDFSLWDEGFTECGIDPEEYLKKRDKEEVLPWQFIRT